MLVRYGVALGIVLRGFTMNLMESIFKGVSWQTTKLDAI